METKSKVIEKLEWPDDGRIDAIGQNGNDGLHYDQEDVLKIKKELKKRGLIPTNKSYQSLSRAAIFFTFFSIGCIVYKYVLI